MQTAKNNTAIHWQQAQQVSQDQAIIQQEKIQEFLESDCGLFTALDLQTFMEDTGKPLSWILENGKNISPLLSEPLSAGHTLDELMHVDPNPSDDIDLFKMYNVKVW